MTTKAQSEDTSKRDADASDAGEFAAHHAATAFTASDEGELAARIVDGAARTPWESVSRDTTDEDLDRARQIIEMVVDACATGDREKLAHLEAGILALAGHAGQGAMTTRRQDFLAYIERGVRYVQSGPGPGPLPQGPMRPSAAARILAPGLREAEPAFAAMTAERFQRALEQVHAAPGGVGREGAAKAAAELALEFKALGLEDDGTADALDRAIRAIRKSRAQK